MPWVMPGSFEGVIQDSASSASLVALITAREVATGFKSNEEGVPRKPAGILLHRNPLLH